MTFRRFAVLGLTLLALAAQPASGDARMQAVMRSKLANTQSLLKAIVTADYKEIDRAALALSRISEMEIVSWQNPPKPDYTTQAMLFMSSVDGLREAARRRDMEAVGAEYAALVSTCIHCHTYVRDARAAALTFQPADWWTVTTDSGRVTTGLRAQSASRDNAGPPPRTPARWGASGAAPH